MTTWTRVSRGNPCPICNHSDWCLISPDETACICPRTESPKQCGEAGYLHQLDHRSADCLDHQRVVRIGIGTPLPDLTPLALRCQQAAGADRLRRFGSFLGLSYESLITFGVGWYADELAWSFPMTNPKTGNVTGIRLRRPDGSKFAVSGGKDGLFLPRNERSATAITSDLLVITEGPTDAIAAFDLGFLNVAGRASCLGGTRHLVSLIKAQPPASVAILADADARGIDGANRLAAALMLHSRSLRVVTPPARFKDLRAWKLAGATRDDLDQLIRSAPLRRLTIKLTTGGHR